jgi:aminoglycoside 6-adenylyltransferase
MYENEHFLEILQQSLVDWAQDVAACRAVILFGSMARSVRPGDKYSDRDILLYVTDPNSDQYIEWMRQYAPPWMVIREHNAATCLWLIVYRGGHAVHLSINSVDDLQEVVDTQTLTTDQQRGYRILVDKDGLAAKLPPPATPPYEPPSEAAFIECIENFFYGTILIAKQLKRGNLWTVQWANCIERGFMLNLIEWYTHALHHVDTWHRGEFMQEWLDKETWQQLHEIAGHFDLEDSWRALFASITLFRRLARATASHFDYPYPEVMISEVISYLEVLRAGDK